MNKSAYKAKRLSDGEWVYGDLLQSDEQRYIVPSMGVVCIEEYKQALTDRFIQLYAYEVDPKTVCRNTFLEDIKGNEVWEHDIAKAPFFCGSNYKDEIGIAEWLNGAFALSTITKNTVDIS